MIPKKIHYCWFGRNPKPKLAERCIRSWEKYCPDYEIIEWNEDNYDISAAPLYVRQAYDAKKWAFMTDYIRLQVVYENGGIYMDTDVELRKCLNDLLDNGAYFGYEDGVDINTGLGFGAEKGLPLLKEMMDDYVDIPFLLPDGTYDTAPCPGRNTKVFIRHGLTQDNSLQVLEGNIQILPSEYLCPIDGETKIRRETRHTISVHWFDASWQSLEQKTLWDSYTRTRRREYYSDAVKMGIKRIVGDRTYKFIKRCMKRGGEEHAED